MVQDTASALFGVEGLQVIEAEAEADGTVRYGLSRRSREPGTTADHAQQR